MARCAVLSPTALVSLLSLLECASAHYTPTWAVHIPDGLEAADAVARDHGFINLGEIFAGHYHFHHSAVARRSAAAARAPHGRLERDARVRWARQQRALSRQKRDLHATPHRAAPESLSSPPPSASRRDAAPRRAAKPSRATGRPRAADDKFNLNDPKWPHMWYLNRGGGLDMNVVPAWREGVTGRGVVVTILDDGLETDHPDLAANYDPQASYDVNSHDSDPQPRYDMIDSNRHGTRCAGEVAAVANNSLCAVGVAFGASVGGVRMLDGDVTDAVEARSLSLNPQHVDIYSASWGPDDDGKTVDGPGELATRAFIEGVTKGRNGKGSIFVWASGNGGREHDNCNCDGYTNSIWTLSISSATEKGEVPWYSEKCSSTLAATYSSGAINDKQVVTTDLHHSCTAGHTGTSASAPLAAGICALALQANRELTWRDMQHIVVRTARPERLAPGGEWRVNGAGRNVSHSFGYGLLDAAAMVRLARAWRRVPPQRRCELAAPRPQRAVPPRSAVTLQLDVVACPGVNYLEHVQARISLNAARRGDLRITLTSPAGTKVTLLTPRPHDSSRAGFSSWPFMSVHMWGEAPLGAWRLEVTNEGRYMAGPLTQWELIFYGTETPAQEYDASPETNSLGEGGTPPGVGAAAPSWSDINDAAPLEDVRQNALDDESFSWHEHTISEDSPPEAAEGVRGAAEGVRGAAEGVRGAAGASARSGCAPPHLCPECAKGLHLYSGRCYAMCPRGTFAGAPPAGGRALAPVPEGVAMKRQDSLETNYNNISTTEALNMEPPANETGSRVACMACHASCATCWGAREHQCLSCAGDALLVNLTESEPRVYCCPPSAAALYAALGAAALALGALAACALLARAVRRQRRAGHHHSDIAYNKLAADEKQQSALDLEREIRRALSEHSATDSDDEL